MEGLQGLVGARVKLKFRHLPQPPCFCLRLRIIGLRPATKRPNPAVQGTLRDKAAQRLLTLNYLAHPFDPARSDDLHKRERNTAIKRLAVAGRGGA